MVYPTDDQSLVIRLLERQMRELQAKLVTELAPAMALAEARRRENDSDDAK